VVRKGKKRRIEERNSCGVLSMSPEFTQIQFSENSPETKMNTNYPRELSGKELHKTLGLKILSLAYLLCIKSIE
jgi:hypothetical protein